MWIVRKCSNLSHIGFGLHSNMLMNANILRWLSRILLLIVYILVNEKSKYFYHNELFWKSQVFIYI